MGPDATWNAEVDESQTGIKIARRNINNLRYIDDIILIYYLNTYKNKSSGHRFGYSEVPLT